MLKADLTIEEVPIPMGNRCAGGHCPPAEWEQAGPGTPKVPMKFYRVSGLISGIYCDACLAIANYIAAEQKKRRIP